MLKILRDRFVRLGRDEDGVALVVTLGVFMFLYVACAGVYAVGIAVKEKLHLQGACDAAAYSAAIVQADTFSRIATINRAMSWTYQQMTRRQMDYIVWQWLEEVVEHHSADLNSARQYAYDHNRCSDNAGGKCSHHVCYGRRTGWDCSDITLEGRDAKTYTEEYLRALIDTNFPEWLRNDNAASFYSQSATLAGLGRQIDDDLRNIYRMSVAVDNLARNLPGRIDAAASAILQANVPNYMTDGDCQYFVDQDSNPRTSYFKPFENTQRDEQIFISYDNSEVKTQSDIFKAGIDTWFVRGEGRHQDGGEGIHRSYDHTRAGPPLRAHWTWWATGWDCGTTSKGVHWRNANGHKTSCSHPSHDKCRCSERPSGSHLMYAQCSADNSNRYDNRYKGIVYIEGEGWKTVYAKPLKLKEDYFGKAGTITVGLARRNENPWFSVFGRVTGGIYSAFSPAQNSWTYCFASAKAGYKLYHETNDWYIDAHLGSKERTWHLDDWEEELNGNVRAWDGPRDYCIDWKPEQSKFAGWYWDKNERGDDVLVTEWTMPDELWPTWRQSWNLVQDDWDAVMVPVRQAGAEAIETQNYSLGEWWQKRLSGQYGKVSDISDRYEPAWQGQDSGYLASLVNDADWQVLSGSGVPNTGVTAGTTTGGTSQWNIGTPGGSLDWNQIGDEMYH